MPSPSNVAHPTMVRLLTVFDDDRAGAAEALVILLEKPTQTPPPAPRDPDHAGAAASEAA